MWKVRGQPCPYCERRPNRAQARAAQERQAAQELQLSQTAQEMQRMRDSLMYRPGQQHQQAGKNFSSISERGDQDGGWAAQEAEGDEAYSSRA